MRLSLRALCALATAVVVTVPGTAAYADPPSPAPGTTTPTTTTTPGLQPQSVPEAQRADAIGVGWQRSADRMWTTSGDATGFHVLVAEAKTGYTWRTAATLSERGVEADLWIGNACVTGSGRRAVVVYAPRTYTNRSVLFGRGGFTAVVDLVTGVVTRLPVRTTLAYYNPGCGTGETAVLTQGGDEDLGKTRVLTVDTTRAEIGKRIDVPGQLTSAIPVKDGIVAADSGAVVRLRDDGRRVVAAIATGTPSHLRADADGGVVFLENAEQHARIRRVARTDHTVTGPSAAPVLATGPLGQIGVSSSANGKVFITGRADRVAALPRTVGRLTTAQDSNVSTQAESAVTGVDSPAAEHPLAGDGTAGPVSIGARSLRTGKNLAFSVDPNDTLAPRSTDDPDHTCAVPRNNPNVQVYQPKPKQVEWAVDMAVKDDLRITRPANWKHNGTSSSYVPEVMFPQTPLKNTTNGQVPAQIMLGILGQESNLWQASRNILPGETGNPLIGNYYGNDVYNGTTADDWDIDFSKADCGYGVSQMTDGMRLAGKTRPHETPLSPDKQKAIATDYAANVAAGLALLESKWNLVQDKGMTINNNDPSRPENWFFAVWAYNAGYHEPGEADTAGAYGLGWAQNPANPNFDQSRGPFGANPHDFAVPQLWPYPEKVLGFAANTPSVLEAPDTYVPMFRPAWWNTDVDRTKAVPPHWQFCASTNNCEYGHSYVPDYPGNGSPGTDVRGEPAGPCAHKNGNYYDLKCWWHGPSIWKQDCATSCGHEFIRYEYPQYAAEQADGTSYPPKCSLDLPSGALVIDDIPNSVPNVSSPSGCSRPTNAGSLSFSFATDSAGREASKIDFHQVGGGFGGHFWFDNTRTSTDQGGKLAVTGTWTFSASQNNWARLLVHLPDHHALTQQARYEIDTGSGSFSHTRYVNQARRANNWVSLGVYKFNGVPRIRLGSVTDDGTGDDDIAWDAVAMQKLPAKPKNIVAVLGDSYTSGEGVGNYFTESDRAHGTDQWNACRRSKDAWSRRLVLPGTTDSVGIKADRWDTDLEFGFVACSGAMTANIGDWAPSDFRQSYREGEFREVRQVDSGVLTGDTTLVMVTMGGNDDAGFSLAVSACGSITDCANDDNFLPSNKKKIDQMIINSEATLGEIHGRAGSAQIVLMGYPELLSRTVKCTGSWYYDMDEVAALAELVNYADSEQQKMVDRLKSGGMKIAYANPVPAFVGHGGCDSDEWINKIVAGPNGDGDFHKGDPATPFCLPDIVSGACLSRASFHPKDAGTGNPGYAGVMRTTLDQIGYKGS